MPVKIFFCYAHEDEALVDKLKMHLRLLHRQGFIKIWHDRNISAGMEWQQEVDKNLNTADIILLLISPHFMASDYCFSIEMKRAIERYECREALVIPIILRPVDWAGTPFSKLQALPKDSKPVISRAWRNTDEAFANISHGIRQVINLLPMDAKLREKETAIFQTPIYDQESKAEEKLNETVTIQFKEPSNITNNAVSFAKEVENFKNFYIYKGIEFSSDEETLDPEDSRQRRLEREKLLGDSKYKGSFLYIIEGEDAGRIIKLKGILSIGRHSTMDIILADFSVSRYHATLFTGNNKDYFIKDAGSSNGTMLNSSALHKDSIRYIRYGDKILIGDTVLVFFRALCSAEYLALNDQL